MRGGLTAVRVEGEVAVGRKYTLSAAQYLATGSPFVESTWIFFHILWPSYSSTVNATK